MTETAEKPEIAIYVHWPFCKAKCPYCDFNSHVRHEPIDVMAFADALVSELTCFAPLISKRKVTSVFFGGGTPSLMPPAAVARVLETISCLWQVDAGIEITLEANPTSVEAKNFRGYRAAGVNRLSVGVQALNDNDLKMLGRQHTAEEALAAFGLASRIFPRVSFDMIYARPNQSVSQWRDELIRALKVQQGHMSLYQLTIEEGTRFHDLHRIGSLAIPTEDEAAALFDITQELTLAHGLAAYEVSNHARPGHESRHNMVYWRYGDYIGVGPGAHSRLGLDDGERLAISTERHPETWRNLVISQGHGRIEQMRLTPADQGVEMLLMGLRLTEGISLGRYHELTGLDLDAGKISLFAEEDLLIHDRACGRLTTTPKGRRVLNALTAALSTAG
jgi:putative oxygen-independent coproporphyrinogen III oxidase